VLVVAGGNVLPAEVVVVAAVLVGAEVVVAAVFVGARVVAVVVGTGLATVFACVTAGAGADDVAAVVAGAGAGGVDIDIDTGLGAIDTDTYDKRTVSCFLVVFDSIIASFSMDDGVARGDVFSSTEPVVSTRVCVAFDAVAICNVSAVLNNAVSASYNPPNESTS
jgi:hypothetical protein